MSGKLLKQVVSSNHLKQYEEPELAAQQQDSDTHTLRHTTAGPVTKLYIQATIRVLLQRRERYAAYSYVFNVK